MQGTCLTSSFPLYRIDCARAITRCARVTLRDWLSKSINDYYPTENWLNEIEKEFSTITIKADGEEYEFDYNEEIIVERNGNVIQIPAYKFNKDTDLLGIE